MTRSLEWVPIQYDWCPYVQRDIWTWTHAQGMPYEDDTKKRQLWEDGGRDVVSLLQVQECLGLPKAGRGMGGPSPRAFRESTALPTS